MTMKLEGVTNFGNLLVKFRSYDKNNDGYITPDEDPEVKSLDVDMDGRASLLEIMRAANLQQKKTLFTKREIAAVRESMQSMPDVSPSNIVHLILALEGDFLIDRDKKQLYGIVNNLIKRMKQASFAGLSPEDTLKRAVQIMQNEQKFNIIGCATPNIRGRSAHLLNVMLLQKRFDCVSFAYTLMIIGHELKWPLSLILMPNHVAVRWEAGASSFSFERPHHVVKDFNIYIKTLKLSDISIKSGAYLRPLSEEEFLAQIYYERGEVKSDFFNIWGSVSDFSIAIALAPRAVNVYGARIEAYEKLFKYTKVDYFKTLSPRIYRDKQAIKRLDPDILKRDNAPIIYVPECNYQRKPFWLR